MFPSLPTRHLVGIVEVPLRRCRRTDLITCTLSLKSAPCVTVTDRRRSIRSHWNVRIAKMYDVVKMRAKTARITSVTAGILQKCSSQSAEKPCLQISGIGEIWNTFVSFCGSHIARNGLLPNQPVRGLPLPWINFGTTCSHECWATSDAIVCRGRL